MMNKYHYILNSVMYSRVLLIVQVLNFISTVCIYYRLNKIFINVKSIHNFITMQIIGMWACEYASTVPVIF